MNGTTATNEDWSGYTTICRLCMQRDGFMLGIFNHIQGKEKSISRKIMDCTALEIQFGDGLPNSICHRCLYKIEFCLEFRQQCFVSDATLRQINGLAKQVPQPFAAVNGGGAPPEAGGDVVMVVDPNTLDYESDYESEVNGGGGGVIGHAIVDHHNSDNETNDLCEFRNVFMCKFCDRAFTDKTDCGNHETADHNNVVPYECSLCGMNFADRLQYSAHLKSVHQNDKPYNCPECERTFARRSDLRKHTIVHTGIKPFTCHICFKSFSRNTNLSKHIRIHKGQKPFVCPTCPKTFISKLELTRHAVTHTGIKPFKCQHCHLSFGRKDKLLRHQKRHFPATAAAAPTASSDKAPDKKKARESMATEYGFINQDSNENNIENKEEDSKPEWPSTENMIINIDPFTHDDQIEQINTEPDMPMGDDQEAKDAFPQVPEHITGDSFSNQESENGGQEETPERVKRFPCGQCHKRFSSAEGLHLHRGIHTGNRPFSCTVCTKGFMRKRELERHMATHTGMKPFKCSSCSKCFGRKDKLVRHARIHDVNKEHICMICGASFNRKDGLVHHMKTHTRDDDPDLTYSNLI
ncbi:PREDICTED: zinc finger protein 436 isoform X2 [Nicrophorus vespilloides]|uniref:Zinc finger protein 436 isoform X2 n=1 Tax=Nicrophorus vespilloides TaxID=110193 RepID=A0ABM1MJT1_NICVS|nr:PREDICTED: zinc finger protein 436 isoform X2 [Nicrophorus vespilloides]